MKFLALLFFLPVFGFAESEPVPCRSMLNIMSDIEISFRLIGKNFTKPDQRDQVVIAIAQLNEFFLEARGCPPKSIINLEEPDRAVRLADFERLIDEVTNLILGLREAVLVDQTDLAKGLIQKLKEKKREGHNLFH